MASYNRRALLGAGIVATAITARIPIMGQPSGKEPAPAALSPPPWFLDGFTLETCTCRGFCILNLGPSSLHDWHRAACIWHIKAGHSNGVDLADARIAMAYEVPPAQSSAKGAMRIYIDASANRAQRTALEAIFLGRRGGIFAQFNDSLSTQLPVAITTISVMDGHTPSAKIGDVGHVIMRRHLTPTAKQAILKNAAYPEAFGVAEEDLCDATGSGWTDPVMVAWHSGGAGGVAAFKLTG